MDIEKVKELALANGFKFKEQADGSMDLNAYVYDFANAIEREAKAQAVLEVKPSRCVTLTCAQLREAFMFGAPDKDDQEQLETEMTITWSENGHSGKGYYCYYSDLPEEGAIFLDDVIEAQEQAND